jgi:hypothetical protein
MKQMLKRKIIILLHLIILLCISCEEKFPIIEKSSIEVQLTKNQSYEYNTLIGGDEEGAIISIQAKHFSVSEIERDLSSNFVAIYKYKPELDYLGKDMAEIKTSTGSDGADPSTNFEYITINFSITE